jgi:hypothetical protein
MGGRIKQARFLAKAIHNVTRQVSTMTTNLKQTGLTEQGAAAQWQPRVILQGVSSACLLGLPPFCLNEGGLIVARAKQAENMPIYARFDRHSDQI